MAHIRSSRFSNESNDSYLFLIDFDRTIANGHIHNMVATAIQFGKVGADDKIGQWNLVKGVLPRGSAQKWKDFFEDAIEAGHKAGIISFNSYPHIIEKYLTETIGLSKHTVEKLHINAWLPLDPSKANKNIHIEGSIAYFKFDGDKKRVVVVDDDELRNCIGAQQAGYVAIHADPDDQSACYLETLKRMISLGKEEMPTEEKKSSNVEKNKRAEVSSRQNVSDKTQAIGGENGIAKYPDTENRFSKNEDNEKRQALLEYINQLTESLNEKKPPKTKTSSFYWMPIDDRKIVAEAAIKLGNLKSSSPIHKVFDMKKGNLQPSSGFESLYKDYCEIINCLIKTLNDQSSFITVSMLKKHLQKKLTSEQKLVVDEIDNLKIFLDKKTPKTTARFSFLGMTAVHRRRVNDAIIQLKTLADQITCGTISVVDARDKKRRIVFSLREELVRGKSVRTLDLLDEYLGYKQTIKQKMGI